MFLLDSSALARARAYCTTALKAWLREAEALFIAETALRSARARRLAHFHLASHDARYFLPLSPSPSWAKPSHRYAAESSASLSSRAALVWCVDSIFASNESSVALRIQSLRRIARSWSLSGAENSDKT